MKTVLITLRVNGENHEVAILPEKTLLEVLREDLGLTGTKHGCELGECGACTVLMDGEPRLSCLVLTLDCEGVSIETIEGMATADGPHPLQRAFAELNAAQCGYCSPGFLLTAKALLKAHREPDRETMKEELAGNLCRCTGYEMIYKAVERAASEMKSEAGHAE